MTVLIAYVLIVCFTSAVLLCVAFILCVHIFNINLNGVLKKLCNIWIVTILYICISNCRHIMVRIGI